MVVHSEVMGFEKDRIKALEQAELRARAEKEEAVRLAQMEAERIEREARDMCGMCIPPRTKCVARAPMDYCKASFRC